MIALCLDQIGKWESRLFLALLVW